MVLIKFIFYVHNLTSRIIFTKYTIFIKPNCAYFTNNPIYLILVSSPSTTKGSQLLFVNIDFFHWQTFFFFISLFLLIVLISILFFLFRFNLIFLVIFSWFCCNFLLHGELIMISNFLPRRFVQLTNLGTF